MNIWEAFLLASAFTLACAGYVGEKVIEIDLSGLLPKNWKRAKRKRLLTKRSTPLEGAGLHNDIKKSFEQVLLPLYRADEKLLPSRMDRTFRRNTGRQLELLKQRKLFREIRLADVVPLPKNNFKRWNDDSREWRESILQCSVLERLASSTGGKTVQEIYRKHAYVRILQSRHIRNSDRIGKRENYYADNIRVICPSCGAEIELNSQQTVCPYCGGVIQSIFYDWQTEIFEIYEEIGTNLRKALYLLMSSLILFACVFLCLWLISDTQVSLAAGFGASILVLVSIIITISRKTTKQEKLEEEIVRYSENYLRSCINEELYRKVSDTNLMEYNVGTIILKKVVNTEKTTQITARIYISETYLPEDEKPYMKKYKRTLTLQRARYPERRKSDGNFFMEKDCPSCGANFIPDENHCCSFCGYGLQVSNAKWVMQTTKESKRRLSHGIVR